MKKLIILATFFLFSILLVQSSHTNSYALFENPQGINTSNITLYGFGITFPDGTTQTTTASGVAGSGSPWQIGEKSVSNGTLDVNFGFGTSSPSSDSIIEINGTATSTPVNYIMLTNVGAFASGKPAIVWNQSAGQFLTARIMSEPGSGFTNSKFFIAVADASKTLIDRLTINVKGFVGIGTTNPGVALDVIGDINQSGNYTGNQIYGEIWFHNDTSDGFPTVISTAGILVNISGFNQPVGDDAGQELNGFSFETGNALQAQVAGMYMVDYSMSWQKSSGGGVDKEYEIHISVNGTTQHNMEVHRVITSANAVGAASELGLIRLLEGDHIYMQVNATDGTDNIGVHTITLTAIRIGN